MIICLSCKDRRVHFSDSTVYDYCVKCHAELVALLEKIKRISCGEDQVADNDSDGMGVIYKLIQDHKVT